MNVQLTNEDGTIIWLPIYTMNESPELSWWYWVLRSLELFLHIPALILTALVCRIASKNRIFHVNMTIIIVTFLAQWIECFVARLCILPYQEGWIQVGGNDALDCKKSVRTLHDWARKLQVPKEQSLPRYPNVALKLPLAVISGRISQDSLRLCYDFYCYSICRGTVHRFFLARTYFYLNYYNFKIQKRMNEQYRTYAYSLAKRYQARENLRCLKLMSYLVATAVGTLTFNGILLTLGTYRLVSDFVSNIMFSIMEAVLNLNALYIAPVTILSMPTWRTAFLKQIPHLCRRFPKRTTNRTQVQPIGEADEYFNQFKMLW
ncbi:unnamed protein product [Caenorhabditis auriculariae]|uniref:G protein-coupled receptor n=1 Tax=Caenorhabditis auriculariae TaxID=2777116 RepID=A0A8S1HGR6_9PELO|nr:unnamed protein product [Caenorhabditis auriculariae]